MRPGITIQHAREESRETGFVRSDVAGFIGVITKRRWPRGARRGDFRELHLVSYQELVESPLKSLIDPVTRRAVRCFFENGGRECHLFGLCIQNEGDLMTEDPFSVVFHGILDRLRSEEDIAILAMPALAYLPIDFRRGGKVEVPYDGVLQLLLEHCREMNNRFLVIDPPRDLHEDALITWVRNLRKRCPTTCMFGGVYYPWVRQGDESFPPSGPVVGLYARSDLEHAPFGVRWPPANQVVVGVTHPAYPVIWSETGPYMEEGINLLISQPGRGVIVWGARTLSKDPKWLHINSRRIVSYIAEQIRRDSEWVVFEHQRAELWNIVQRMVASRLDLLWGAGLLTGDRAGSDYTVQCDAEVNSIEVREAGQVHCRVLLRPIATAEFIVVELRLGTDGGFIGAE